jgi:hypothetical protein
MLDRFSDYKILDYSGCTMESHNMSVILDLQQRIVEYNLSLD